MTICLLKGPLLGLIQVGFAHQMTKKTHKPEVGPGLTLHFFGVAFARLFLGGCPPGEIGENFQSNFTSRPCIKPIFTLLVG